MAELSQMRIIDCERIEAHRNDVCHLVLGSNTIYRYTSESLCQGTFIVYQVFISEILEVNEHDLGTRVRLKDLLCR